MWYNIHDFSQDSSEKKNFQILGKFYKVSDFLPKCDDAVASVIEIDYEKSLVPLLTLGESSDDEESCLMIVFKDSHLNNQLIMDTKSRMILEKMMRHSKLTLSRAVNFDGLLATELKDESKAIHTPVGHIVNMFVVSWMTIITYLQLHQKKQLGNGLTISNNA